MRKMTASEFLIKLFHRIWSTNSILLLVRPGEKPMDESLRKPCPGVFCAVTSQNLSDCEQLCDVLHNTKTFRSLLKRGDYGYYGYLDGHCVYCEWIKNHDVIGYEGCTVHTLSENERYRHYVFCAPSARGLGFQTESGYRAITNEPDHTFYALVEPDNISSLKNFHRNGYEIRSRITVKCRFLRRTLTETLLTPAESDAFLPR